jgi:hypothetical protein
MSDVVGLMHGVGDEMYNRTFRCQGPHAMACKVIEKDLKQMQQIKKLQSMFE